MSADASRGVDIRVRALVFRQSERKLQRFFSRRIRQPSDIGRELTQEVCVRFLAAEQITSKNQLGYLFGIARHVLTDFLRESSAHPAVSIDPDQLCDGEVQGFSFGDPAECVETEVELQRALTKLSKPHLSVLIAREWYGYSYREIAQRLALSEQTVEKYLFLAKSAVRAQKRLD